MWDDEGITAYATTKQWLRDGAEILGATGDDFTVRLADIDHSISLPRARRGPRRLRSRATSTRPARRSARSPASRATRASAGRSPARAAPGMTPAAPATTPSATSGTAKASSRRPAQSYTVTTLDVDKQLRCTVIVEGKTEANSPTIYGLPPTQPDDPGD